MVRLLLRTVGSAVKRVVRETVSALRSPDRNTMEPAAVEVLKTIPSPMAGRENYCMLDLNHNCGAAAIRLSDESTAEVPIK